jgi:DNA invertase Pin-like site-specific DNA recombinase
MVRPTFFVGLIAFYDTTVRSASAVLPAALSNATATAYDLMSRGLGFRSITEGLHTEGAMGKAMLTIMAAFAQLERNTMIERARAGLSAAAANGRKGGRRCLGSPAPPRIATFPQHRDCCS